MEKQLFSLPAVRSPERAAMEVSAAGRCDAEDPCCGHCFITGAKDRTLQNGRAEIYGLAIFHELLEHQNNYAHYNLFYSRRLVHFAQ